MSFPLVLSRPVCYFCATGQKMKIKRNRPALHVTVSPDIAEWVHRKAGTARGAVSRFAERLMYDAMVKEKARPPEGKKGAPSPLAVRPVRGLAAVLGGTKAGAKK